MRGEPQKGVRHAEMSGDQRVFSGTGGASADVIQEALLRRLDGMEGLVRIRAISQKRRGQFPWDRGQPSGPAADSRTG